MGNVSSLILCSSGGSCGLDCCLWAISSLILCSSGGSCGLDCCLWTMYHHLYCVVQVVVVV